MRFLCLLVFSISLNLLAQYPNDCTNYIQACGNKSINLDVSGVGNIQEIRNKGCSSFEHNSLWIRVTIETAGTLEFTLTPGSTNISEDYDFWVFGPDVKCNDIGNAIRCSTTNPLAANQGNNKTGMNSAEIDTSEGPGEDGNSFVKAINVQAGESYFIVIDRPIGRSNFTLDWTGTAKLVNPLESKDIKLNLADINICDEDFDGFASFNLRTLDDKIIKDKTGIAISYYENETNANSSLNPLSDIVSLRDKTYYARVENPASGCFKIAKFDVNFTNKIFDLGEINVCPNEDGNYYFKLADVKATELQQSISYNFYEHLSDAKLGNSNYLLKSQTIGFNEDKKLFVRINNDNKCYTIGKLKINARKPPNLKVITQNICLDNIQQTINLNNYKNLISNSDVKFYYSEEDYKNNNPINNTNRLSVNLGKTSLYVVAENDFCSVGGNFTLNTSINPTQQVPKVWQFCREDLPNKLTLPEVDSSLNYEWNIANQTVESPIVDRFGEYQLTVKNSNQCFKTYDFEVKEIAPLSIKEIKLTNNSLQIIPKEIGDFLYSIDGNQWESSNTFTNLKNGVYTAYVKRKTGCISEPKKALVLLIYNVITPNGDGKNDFIIFPSMAEVNGKLKIFDRNGQVLVEKDLTGEFRWNGNAYGRQLPQDDYWYIINTDINTYSGHITIKSH